MRAPLNQVNRQPNLDFSYQTREGLLRQARRLSDGTINYDFYKARAQRLRQAAMAAQMRALGRLVMQGLRALLNWGTSAATVSPRVLKANHAK